MQKGGSCSCEPPFVVSCRNLCYTVYAALRPPTPSAMQQEEVNGCGIHHRVHCLGRSAGSGLLPVQVA